jgi:hypothetical protein
MRGGVAIERRRRNDIAAAASLSLNMGHFKTESMRTGCRPLSRD